MGLRKQREKVQQPVGESVKQFCERTTIHGLSYFFDDITIIERIFWICITSGLIIYGFVTVQSTLAQWNANPIATITENHEKPVTELKFPTVTICPDFPPDRWGFLRNVLNLLKIYCNEEEGLSCSETEELRELLRSTFLSNHGELEFPELVFADLIHSLTFPATENELVDVIGGCIAYNENQLNCMPQNLNYINSYVLINCDSLDITAELRKKLAARGNNYSFFKTIGFNLSRSLLSYSDGRDVPFTHETINQYYEQCIIYANRFLSLPMPGKVGTLLAKSFHRTIITPRWYDNLDIGLNSIYKNEEEIIDYLFNISKSLTGSKQLELDPLDISAILYPTESFYQFSKYYKQFPLTLKRQSEKLNLTSKELLNRRNFFGNLLGPHLPMIMEMMFHNMLRTRTLTNQRYLDLSQIYGDISRLLRYPLDTKDHIKLSWTDYNLVEKFPYWWTTSFTNFAALHSMLSRGFAFERDPKTYSSEVPIQEGEKEYTDNVIEELRERYQHQQMILHCSGPRQDSDCRPKFSPMLTDKGICHSFNAPGFTSTFHDNTYMEHFKLIFSPSEDDQVLQNENSGVAFQLNLVLDNHMSNHLYEKPVGSFIVAVTDNKDFMSVRTNAVQVNPGQQTKISVLPTGYSADEKLEDLDINSRRCRFKDELDSEKSLFKNYSHEACRFECRLKNADQVCGCTPWNYPHYGDGKIRKICDGVQALCFEKQMSSSRLDCGHCLPDCNRIEYLRLVSQEKLNVVKECGLKEVPGLNPLEEQKLGVYVAEKIKHMDGEELFFWTNLFKDQSRESISEHSKMLYNNSLFKYMNLNTIKDKCEEMIEEDIAVLTVEVGKPYFLSYKKQLSVDFFSKLGLIGGTIGLFAGVSMLSFVEIIFWILRNFIKKLI